MAHVNISEAARLAGITRSYLYKKYINSDLITVSTDKKGKKYIDTSELLRVFGELKSETGDSVENTPKEGSKTGSERELLIHVGELQAEIKHLAERLETAQGRETFYQVQIQSLTDTMKLLEEPKQHPRLWWQFWK